MFVDEKSIEGEATSQERRNPLQNDKRILGRVIQCDGSRAMLAAYADAEDGSITALWTVGKLISINLGEVRTVGLVYAIDKADRVWDDSGLNRIEVNVELIGEVRDDPATGVSKFDRGVTVYPHIGAMAHRIRSRDLHAVYDVSGSDSVTIGNLSQDESVQARISINSTLDRHFAVVGTTGVGKSTAVSLLLHKTIETRPDLRILIMDPHNEFAQCFGDKTIRIDTSTLDLPFWLFRLEELVEVLYRGREPVPDEVDLLRDIIPVAKLNYRSGAARVSVRRGGDSSITSDTPIPYRITDLLRLIDERMGLLDSKQERPFYRALRTRLEAAINDPRYRFMFNSHLIEDTIHTTIGRIFRVPLEGRPVTCFEMAGMPSEVVNAVCSVLARLAFDLTLWSAGKLKLLVLCEEAHRYMPSDPKLGFAPTRHALSRIAKEGRKYGCYLGIVTQRPGELDSTILSQCSTVFAMRLANERDQEIIRSAIADSSQSALSFLSSMGQREAIAFGEGVATTMRMKFERLDAALIPGTRKEETVEETGSADDDVDLAAIVGKLRNVTAQSQTTAAEGEPIPQQVQAGDPEYRKPSIQVPDEPEDFNYGRRATDTFWRRPNRS
jgi:DNA helicase HerA-like ATPase